MGWERRKDLNAHTLVYMPDRHTPGAALAASSIYEYRHGGDHNPGATYTGDTGNTMVDPVIESLTSADLYVAASVFDIAFLDRYRVVRPGATVALAGEYAELCVYNPDTSATSNPGWSLDSKLSRLSNYDGAADGYSAKAGHPGHAPALGVKVVGVADSAVTVEVEIPSAPMDETGTLLSVFTLSAIKLWAEVSPTVGTFGLEVQDGDSNDILSSSPFDLTGLTAVTVSSITSLDATHKVLAAGETVSLIATSDNAGLSDGTFYALLIGDWS